MKRRRHNLLSGAIRVHVPTAQRAPRLLCTQASSATLFASNTGNSHARLLRFSLLRRTPGVRCATQVGEAHAAHQRSQVPSHASHAVCS